MLILLIGFLSGILSGLAVGGGTLLVPALVFFSGVNQHMAQGITLLSFIPTSIVAVFIHYRQGNVKPRLAIYLTFGTLAGAIVGSLTAVHIPASFLKRIFGIFLVIMGVYEIFCRSKKE